MEYIIIFLSSNFKPVSVNRRFNYLYIYIYLYIKGLLSSFQSHPMCVTSTSKGYVHSPQRLTVSINPHWGFVCRFVYFFLFYFMSDYSSWTPPGPICLKFLAGFLKFSVKGLTFVRKTPGKAGVPSQYDTVAGDFINIMKTTFDFNFDL